MGPGKLPLDPLSGCQEQDGRATLLAEEPLARSIMTGAIFLSLCLLALSQPVAPTTLFPLIPTPSLLSRENESDEPRGCGYSGPGGVATVVHEPPTAFFLNSRSLWRVWLRSGGLSGGRS